MTSKIPLPIPQVKPPLDPEFRPAALASRNLRKLLAQYSGGLPLHFALERPDGTISRYSTRMVNENHPAASANPAFAERILKFLLWQKGASKVHVAGSTAVTDHLRRCYSEGGARRFDYRFLGQDVYGRPLAIVPCRAEDLPAEHESSRPLGRHLDGCRIGFDLGASDRKAAALIDGEPVFCEEVVWEPKKQSDPDYHYREIVSAIEKAAQALPRLDAIGGSSAGICIDNKIRVSSLFRGVPPEHYPEVHRLFPRIQLHFGVPLEVINDGDVTALAGSMSIEDNAVLGIALGSSLAAGYVDSQGHITGWLNELAFAPIDLSPNAINEEWSGDRGCGATYLSQQCVFRLAAKAGITTPAPMPDADRLHHIQQFLQRGHEGARSIWETMGVYLGYAIAHYCDFYDLKHILILGRCTSGRGGEILLQMAEKVMQDEFPEIKERLHLQLPNEKNRRIGQAVAAASLPDLSAQGVNK